MWRRSTVFSCPGYQQLSGLRLVAAEHQCGYAEDAACQQVDDLEEHPASQPSLRRLRWQIAQVSRAIKYSSGTGRGVVVRAATAVWYRTVEACKAAGIGRKTGYRWRLENGGVPPVGLAGRGPAGTWGP
jgi:hypothetical protein